MSDQMRITASSLLLSLEPHELDSERRMRMSEDSSKLSTILHWISIVIGPNTAIALFHDASSRRLTFYLCSSSSHDTTMENATHLLDILRRSLLISSTGGNLSDLENEYHAFVANVCWHRLQDKVNNKVPYFPVVPKRADVSTISSILKTILGFVDAWKAWRVRNGLPDEDSAVISKMRQELNHSQSLDTLKHCFSQVFHPLDDIADRLQQLRSLWRCCYALMKSDFFADVFHQRWGKVYWDRTCFLYRVYRRIWRLYSYKKGIDVLLHAGIPHLISITQGDCLGPPDITFYWIPRDSPSTIQIIATPDQFIFQLGQRRGYRGDLVKDSRLTSQARHLWSLNETKIVNVHPMVSLVTFLYASGIRVMENRIGTSKRPCALCNYYTTRIDLPRFRWQCSQSSDRFRMDWAIPQTLGRALTRDNAETIIADIMDYAEVMACAFLRPPPNDVEEYMAALRGEYIDNRDFDTSSDEEDIIIWRRHDC